MLALFILGIVVILASIGIGVSLKKNGRSIRGKGSSGAFAVPTIIVGCIVGIAFMAFGCLRTVPTGHTGIVTTFGRVRGYTYEAGVHFTAPWNTVVNMDNRNQKASIDLSCFSSDIQEVSVTYTLNYQIEKANAQEIYRKIGTDYYSTVITPRVQETVKSVMAKYTAEELLDNRAQLSTEIRNILTDKLATYNVEVIDTSLENLDFSDAFTDAVEAKQVAEQKAKQAKIEQEQKIMEAEASAQRAKIEAEAAANVATIAAQAELDVTKIQADAAEYAGQKDAAVVKQLRDTFSKNPEEMTDKDFENLLMYYYILKWNGELPSTYVGAEDFYKVLSAVVNQGKIPSEGN